MTLPPELQKIQDSRENVYGPWRENMLGTSFQMCGMLINRFAAADEMAAVKAVMDMMANGLMDDIAPLFMLAVKTNRMASGNYKPDNFIDNTVYQSFVERLQQDADNGMADTLAENDND